ncbi:stAR-related lipid transfer protein 9 [Tiliqua scincoides]|uniref:stAR-related lipid transfer protein 9 n=1 Tax=Tiliqua scincoides TaxID=71010 RepID=UPI0034624C05
MANVKVAVRVRPLSKREHAEGRRIIVEVEDKVAKVRYIKVDNRYEGLWEPKEKVVAFGFDYCYWSVDPEDPNYASQEVVFQDLGTSVLSGAFKGYNICLFAYGQTGSGKTYTMMGTPASIGLTPRICEGLFSREDDCSQQPASCRVEVSFLEIYNERVRDLLRISDHKKPYTLRVREHPETGPYVQGLSRHVVADSKQVVGLLEEGIANRITAATHVHDASSRSHAIFTIQYTQAILENNLPSETASKINLVDLAGSERADPSYCKDRITEGANINKSLVTLGIVISALAQNSQMFSSCQSINSIASEVDSSHTDSHYGPSVGSQRRPAYIPYRDSVLTWLLKDSLGGNSKTIMIATISPASSCYNETMSTLRYASNAKNIINKPRVNEDANVKLIRELREEIDRLKAMLMSFELRNSSPSWSDDRDGNLTELVLQNELKIEQLTKDWTDKWINRKAIMEEYSVDINKKKAGVTIDSNLPHLMAMDDDILSTGVVLYHLREGTTKIGRSDSKQEQDIVLQGQWIEREHCLIDNRHGIVTLQPLQGAHCIVNGHEVTDSFRLSQGALVILGKAHKFRFNHPAEAAILRQRRSISETSSAISCRPLEWLDLDGFFSTPCNAGDTVLNEQKNAVSEESQPKLKNQEVLHSRKIRQQQQYVEELQRQILVGQIKAEQELEHDQAAINQQIRENQQWLINEEQRLAVQQQESAVQTDVKFYTETGVQNTVELEIGPTLTEQNQKKLVQVELLRKCSLKKAERNLRRKKVKLHLERIVKKQKLLEAKKTLEQLEASCWISEDTGKLSQSLNQDTIETSQDCKYPRIRSGSDSKALQYNRNSFLNLRLPHLSTCSFFLKKDPSSDLSTSASNYRCSKISPSRKSLSAEYLPRAVKELSARYKIYDERNGSFPTQGQLTEIQKSVYLGNKGVKKNCRNTDIISDICTDKKMEKVENRPRQTRSKTQMAKSSPPDHFKKKSEPETGKQVTKAKTSGGDSSQRAGKLLENSGTQETNRKIRTAIKKKRQGSHPGNSIKEIKKLVCSKAPGHHLTAKNMKKDLKENQSEEQHEILREATSAGSLNNMNTHTPLCHGERRWHSAEVLSAGISKAAPDPLKSWQEDEDIEFSDTDSTYSVDSLSCVCAKVLEEQLRQEESTGIEDTFDTEGSESDDSQMSQDSLTVKVDEIESQDEKHFPEDLQEPVILRKDDDYQSLLLLVTTSKSDNNLTERSFSLDSLGDADEVSGEDVAEESKLESFDEVPAEVFWRMQNSRSDSIKSQKQRSPEISNKTVTRLDDLNLNTGSFYLDAGMQSGSSSICDPSVEIKISFSGQEASLDQSSHISNKNLPIVADAWLSHDLKHGKSSPIIAMPSSQDHSEFQVAQLHPVSKSNCWNKKDDLRQSAAELSFVSCSEQPHRASHEPSKTEMVFSSVAPSVPLPETWKHLETESSGAILSLPNSARNISFGHVSTFPIKHSYCEVASSPPKSTYQQADKFSEGGSADDWRQTSSSLKETTDNSSEKQDFSVSSVYPEMSTDQSLQKGDDYVNTNFKDCLFRTIEKEDIDYDSDDSMKDSNPEDKRICTLSIGSLGLASVCTIQEKYQGHKHLFSEEGTSLVSDESFYLCDLLNKSNNHSIDTEEEEYSGDKIHLLQHRNNFDLLQKMRYQQVSSDEIDIDHSSSENKLYQTKETAFHHSGQFTLPTQNSEAERVGMQENRDAVTESALEVPLFRELEENKALDEEWNPENHFECNTKALVNDSHSGLKPECSGNCLSQEVSLTLSAENVMGKNSEGEMISFSRQELPLSTCMDLVSVESIYSDLKVNEKKVGEELSVVDSCDLGNKSTLHYNSNVYYQGIPSVKTYVEKCQSCLVVKDVCETISFSMDNHLKESCSSVATSRSVSISDQKHTIHKEVDGAFVSDSTAHSGETKAQQISFPVLTEEKETPVLCEVLNDIDCSGVGLHSSYDKNYIEKDSGRLLETDGLASVITSQGQSPYVNKESEHLKETVITGSLSASKENKDDHNKTINSEELAKLIISVNKLESDIIEMKSSQSLQNYLRIESQSEIAETRGNSENYTLVPRPQNDDENHCRKQLITVRHEERNEEKIQSMDVSKEEMCVSKTTAVQTRNINQRKLPGNTKESECPAGVEASSKTTVPAVCFRSTVLTQNTLDFHETCEEHTQADRIVENEKFAKTKSTEPHTTENLVLLPENPAYDLMLCNSNNNETDTGDAEIPKTYFAASKLDEPDQLLQSPEVCLDTDEAHEERSSAGLWSGTGDFSRTNADIDKSVSVNQEGQSGNQNQNYEIGPVAVKDLPHQLACSPLLSGLNRNQESMKGDLKVAMPLSSNTSDGIILQYYETHMDSDLQAGIPCAFNKRERNESLSDITMQNKYIAFSPDLPQLDGDVNGEFILKKTSSYTASERFAGEDNKHSEPCIAKYRVSSAFALADDTQNKWFPSESASCDTDSSYGESSKREDEKSKNCLHSLNISQKENAGSGSFTSEQINTPLSSLFRGNVEEIMQSLPELSSQECFSSIISQKGLSTLLQYDQANICLDTNYTETEYKTKSDVFTGELGRQTETTDALMHRTSYDLGVRHTDDSVATSEDGVNLLGNSKQALWKNAHYGENNCEHYNMNSCVSEYSASLLNSSATMPNDLLECRLDSYRAEALYLGERNVFDLPVLTAGAENQQDDKSSNYSSSTKNAQGVTEVYEKEKEDQDYFLECLCNQDKNVSLLSKSSVERTEIGLQGRNLLIHKSLEQINSDEVVPPSSCSVEDVSICTLFKAASTPELLRSPEGSTCRQYVDSQKDAFLTPCLSPILQVQERQPFCHQPFLSDPCTSSETTFSLNSKIETDATLPAATSSCPAFASSQRQESLCGDAVISDKQPFSAEITSVFLEKEKRCLPVSDSVSSFQRNSVLGGNELQTFKSKNFHHDDCEESEDITSMPPKIESIGKNLYHSLNSKPDLQEDQNIQHLSSRVDIVSIPTMNAENYHTGVCKEEMKSERNFLTAEQQNLSVINDSMSSEYLPRNSSLSLQEPELEIFKNETIVFISQNKDGQRPSLQSHSLSAPAIIVMSNIDCPSKTSSKIDFSVQSAFKSLQELNMSVEPPSPTEDDLHRTENFSKLKTDNVGPAKYKLRFQKKSIQAQRLSNCDKRNHRESTQGSHSSDASPALYPIGVASTTNNLMDIETGKLSNNVSSVFGCNMDASEELRYQVEATDGLLQDNKDAMHFSSSDINPYIHPWQQDERCKIGWKQYVFGSASDVSSNPPPLSLGNQTVMRCSSVDNGLNSQNSPFHSHLSSYANARTLSSTISSTEDLQGWDAAREGFESVRSDESGKHYTSVSHDEVEKTPENHITKSENCSQQSGDTPMQVDEIVLLYPSESDVSSNQQQQIHTCERETQTEAPARHKRQKRHRRSFTDISARNPEGGRSSSQQPSSWSSVQNLSMHLSQLLHNTSELLGNLSLQTVKDNEPSDQKAMNEKSTRATMFDSYTQTTEDIGIQTNTLGYAIVKNKESQSRAKMESEPMKAQEVNVIVKVLHSDTVTLTKEKVSESKGRILQSMSDINYEDIPKDSSVSQSTLSKDSSPSPEVHKEPLNTALVLGSPEVSPVLSSSFGSTQDESSCTVVSSPAPSISLSLGVHSKSKKPVGKTGNPETRDLYCKSSLLVDRASSPILTLRASSVSQQPTSNKSTSSFKDSGRHQKDTAHSVSSFRKGLGLWHDFSSQESHVDTSSQTEMDSESTTSKESKEMCRMSGNALDKNTTKELSEKGGSKQKHRLTIDTHTAIHTKRLYHSSSTLELSSHGEYLVGDHRETVPLERSFRQIRATRRARNLSGGMKYESPICNSESSPTKKSFKSSLSEHRRSLSLKSDASPECLLDSFSQQCQQTWRNQKCFSFRMPEMSDVQDDDDSGSDTESDCNTEILLNEDTSLVKTHRLRSYSLRDLPLHNKFSNWCGVKDASHSSLTSLTRSAGDIRSQAERKRVDTRTSEIEERSLFSEGRAREIERLRRERAQVLSGIYLDMNQHPLTVELTEAKLNYGIGETDAQLRILQNGAGEDLTSVPIKQQLYERHRKSIEILRKEREERLHCFRRSRSLSPQKHLSFLQTVDTNQRDLDLPSRRREYLQQLRRDVVKNTRVQEPKMRIQHPSEIELLLRDYQRAREETKTEIARARDKLRERAEQEKRRIREQIVTQLQKEETKLKTLVSTNTLCTESTLSLSSGPTSGYNSSHTTTSATSVLGKQEGQTSPEDTENARGDARGRSAIRNHQLYEFEQLRKGSSSGTFPMTSSIERSSIQSSLPSGHRYSHSLIVSPSTFPASPMKGYEDLSKHVLANATAEVMAVCSNDLKNLYNGQATAGWKYQCVEKDVLVYYKAFSSSTTKHGFLGAGIINRPLPTILCMLKDPSKRHLYDKTITTAQVYKKITSSIELVYVVSDVSLCYQKQPRDFCCISVEAKKENVSILAIQSVYEESMPRPCKEMVRGEILPSAWILEPDTVNGRDITKVIYMVQVDLGAPAIPARLLSSIAKRQPLVIARLAHFLAG